MTTVTCGDCGFSNGTGSRFCNECGAPLPVVCPSCGAENGSGSKFCNSCGIKLTGHAPSPPATDAPVRVLASRPSAPAPTPNGPAEERRLVTGLFCDLVGFTPLSERLDPEEVRDIQRDYFAAMRSQIDRYGGTVQKYAGDAVLAFFGAPVAKEDDAERAVLCALRMQSAIETVAARVSSRWDIYPAIRVGVNTGEVVSGVWEIGGRIDVDVTGDAINTAARFQSAAEPGEVLVGAETMHLTRRRIAYGEERLLTLKGKAQPVPAYTALGVREQFGERWEEGERATPLVGRERELVGLLDAWLRAQGGEGGMISLVGDAGVGKSRLAAEFLSKVSATTAPRILRGRCLSYGQEISLWLLADLLRSLLGLHEQDGLEEIRATVGTMIGGLLTGCPTEKREEAIDVLGEVVGLPAGNSLVATAGPEIRRAALIRSLRLVLRALSERTPTLLLLEDLHWIDTASGEVLREVLTDLPSLRLLVIVTQRPGWSPPWSEWGWPERITLRPLREADAALLAGSVLGDVALSPELEQYVAERAGGNPFFVEELLHALQETDGIVERNGRMHLLPAAAQRLPSTLTEILLARLDRLEGQVRTVAQVGSVIGRTFAVRLLAEVIGREQTALEMPLTALQGAEIAFPRHALDTEYVFKHVTMQEVAYNTLVQKRRRELHLLTARAIASLYPSDEYVEIIAYHYGKTEAPEAATWLEQAGDRAAAVYATETAVNHYRETIRCLQTVDGDPRIVASVEEKLGTVLSTAGRYDEALAELSRAVETQAAAGKDLETDQEHRDLEAAGRVTARMGLVHRMRGTPEEGIALVRPMIELLARSGPSLSRASLYLALANLTFLVGRYAEMQVATERAGEIARAIGDERLLGEAEERRALAVNVLGHSEQALQIFQEAIPMVERGGDLFVLWRTLNNTSIVYARLGRMEEATRSMERALTMAERIGNPHQIAFVLGNLGNLLTTVGDWTGAREHLEQAMTLLGEEGVANAAVPLSILGQLALREGRWDDAARLLNEALAVSERTGDRQLLEDGQSYLAELDILTGNSQDAVRRLEDWAAQEDVSNHCRSVLAWALLEEEAVGRAAQVVADALHSARRTQNQIELVQALRVHGMVLMRQGALEEAANAFQEGLEIASSLPYPYAEARILFKMGLLERKRGDPEGARARLDDALAIFRRLGALKDVEQTEQDVAKLV
jgi:adenylate cyclase